MISVERKELPRRLGIVAIVAIAVLTWLMHDWVFAAIPEPLDAVAPRQKIFDVTAPTISSDSVEANFRQSTASLKRVPAISTNLERVRWLPTVMPPNRVEVNTATALLQLFHNNVPVFTTRVIVGTRGKPTPEFEATIESILFNPEWHVPRSIATTEILPKLRTNPGYLRRHKMIIRNGSVVQLPGPHNSLGQLKFEMPNDYDVYLHDTPLKYLFNGNDRRQSHGCVRVQNPRQLAALLLAGSIEVINDAIALGYTNRQFLPIPVPIFIFYQPVSGAYRPQPGQRTAPI